VRGKTQGLGLGRFLRSEESNYRKAAISIAQIGEPQGAAIVPRLGIGAVQMLMPVVGDELGVFQKSLKKKVVFHCEHFLRYRICARGNGDQLTQSELALVYPRSAECCKHSVYSVWISHDL
jgi:hypothetical protein